MAHVQVSLGESPDALKVIIDGVDMSAHIYKTGFGLVMLEDGTSLSQWGLSMVVALESLDLDIPNVVIEAVARSASEMGESA